MLPIAGGWLTGIVSGSVALPLGALSPGAVAAALLAVSVLGLIASTVEWTPRRSPRVQPLRAIQRPLNCR
jgi:hypothetical protein